MSERIHELFEIAKEREMAINAELVEPSVEDLNEECNPYIHTSLPLIVFGNGHYISGINSSDTIVPARKVESLAASGLFEGFAMVGKITSLDGITVKRVEITAILRSFNRPLRYCIPVQNSAPESLDPHSFNDNVKPISDELIQDRIDPFKLEAHCRNLPLYTERELGRIAAMMNFMHQPATSIVSTDLTNLIVGTINPSLSYDANQEYVFNYRNPNGVRHIILPHDEWHLARRGGLINLFIQREDDRDNARKAYFDIGNAAGFELVM